MFIDGSQNTEEGGVCLRNLAYTGSIQSSHTFTSRRISTTLRIVSPPCRCPGGSNLQRQKFSECPWPTSEITSPSPSPGRELFSRRMPHQPAVVDIFELDFMTDIVADLVLLVRAFLRIIISTDIVVVTHPPPRYALALRALEVSMLATGLFWPGLLLIAPVLTARCAVAMPVASWLSSMLGQSISSEPSQQSS